MRNSVRQILLSGALLLGAMTALGAATPVFCGFERFRGQSDSHYETASEGAIYFDGEILFEASASRPSSADDRIVLWYRRASAAAAGELVVTAGFIDPNGLIVSRDYPVATELEDGTYHRVTIRAVDNILEETQTLPGFIVFLDGERLACDVALAYAAEPSRFPLGWAVRERYVDGSTRAVFPSLGVKKVGVAGGAKTTRAGVQGAGGARNCVLTDSVTCDEAELPVARFRAGDEYFADFDSAKDALGVLASDAEHPVLLRLLADFSPAGGVLEIPEETYVTLDLAGHRIEGAIYVYGALEVIDTVGGGTVVGNEDEGCALCIDGGAAMIRAGRWLAYVCEDENLTIVAGEFFDENLHEGENDGGFYLAAHDENGYAYFAKGSYISKVDTASQIASVVAADSSKVTVTFVYGASVWATSQYTANGDDWNYTVGTPTASGYSFTSWLRSDGSVWTQDYSVKADQYVTAAFTNNRYTVTFLDATNGVWAVRSYTYAVDDFEMPAAPEKAGWDLSGWCRSNPGDWKFDCMITADVTVKPTWEKHYEVIEIPRAVVGLLADGTLKIGVVDGVGYTLAGNTGTEAGKYVATATLKNGYKWPSGSRTDASVIWHIYSPEGFADYASAAVTNAVSGELEISADPGSSVSVEGANVMITAGGITTTVPMKSYYDAEVRDGKVVISMNEEAKPTFENAEEEESPIEISDTEFTVALANLHPGFSYRIGTKNSLTDEWSYQPWQTVGDEATLKLSVARDVAATSGFYVIQYMDGDPNDLEK